VKFAFTARHVSCPALGNVSRRISPSCRTHSIRLGATLRGVPHSKAVGQCETGGFASYPQQCRGDSRQHHRGCRTEGLRWINPRCSQPWVFRIADWNPRQCIAFVRSASKEASGAGMSRDSAATYRLHAAHCAELAQRISDPQARVGLLEMAAAMAAAC